MGLINILMKRDGVSKEEAESMVAEVRQMMEDCNYDPFECDDILRTQLGLEPDYIFEII